MIDPPSQIRQHAQFSTNSLYSPVKSVLVEFQAFGVNSTEASFINNFMTNFNK